MPLRREPMETNSGQSTGEGKMGMPLRREPMETGCHTPCPGGDHSYCYPVVTDGSPHSRTNGVMSRTVQLPGGNQWKLVVPIDQVGTDLYSYPVGTNGSTFSGLGASILGLVSLPGGNQWKHTNAYLLVLPETRTATRWEPTFVPLRSRSKRDGGEWKRLPFKG